MALSEADREANRPRQQAWRDRHKGEPRGNKLLMDELAALRARVAQLEPATAHGSPATEPTPATAPARRLRPEMAAVRKECDELAERLERIRAYDPAIEEKGAAWLAQIDEAPRDTLGTGKRIRRG